MYRWTVCDHFSPWQKRWRNAQRASGVKVSSGRSGSCGSLGSSSKLMTSTSPTTLPSRVSRHGGIEFGLLVDVHSGSESDGPDVAGVKARNDEGPPKRAFDAHTT
jgi:hypothetical protein